MSKDYANKYGKALKYSGADQSTVEHFLHALSRPEHRATRTGTGDHTLRLVAADALQDRGRESEAELLRQEGQHVVVHGGEVRPGRLTHRGVGPKKVFLDEPTDPDEGHTLYRYEPSTEYMRGRHWGGEPRWCITDDFDTFPSREELKRQHPDAIPHHEAFGGELFDEVHRPLTPEEMNEELDPDHPHERGRQ